MIDRDLFLRNSQYQSRENDLNDPNYYNASGNQFYHQNSNGSSSNNNNNTNGILFSLLLS